MTTEILRLDKYVSHIIYKLQFTVTIYFSDLIQSFTPLNLSTSLHLKEYISW